MNSWIIITLAAAGAVFGIDYLLRKKKWKENTKKEKTSLLVNMFSTGPYIFISALGMLWGIVAENPETAFGKAIYDATLMMAGYYFVVAVAAAVSSLILRKKEKTKLSILVNIIALAYITVVLAVNSLAGEIL
ncbi:MAG: hypothetical protein IKU47_00505 [Oscillospiraceae bacterium]|nr:hypothetical protein [Oscillospiraceae bacterium]